MGSGYNRLDRDELADVTAPPRVRRADDAQEVDAYALAAPQACLDALEDTLAEQVGSLGPYRGWLLDAGMGAGSIPLKILPRPPGLEVVGIGRLVGIG